MLFKVILCGKERKIFESPFRTGVFCTLFNVVLSDQAGKFFKVDLASKEVRYSQSYIVVKSVKFSISISFRRS